MLDYHPSSRAAAVSWLPLSLLLAVAPVFGQSVPAPAPSPSTLERYDKNKNGVLDADELAAFQAAEKRDAKAPVASDASPNAGEVVAMSPFEVNAGGDKGYFGANTLSGTRLNSKIEDLGASITVVTKQQLLDTAALDLNDVFMYEANTEGVNQFTDPTNDGRGIYDNVAGNPQTANRIRGLNSANISVNGFSSTSTIPLDIYNTDSVEISRGPNANIFGLGDASGTVNINRASANVTRESSNVTGRVDSYGGFRSSTDLNRPLIKNKLAVRVSAVYEERGFIRKPAMDRTNRAQFSLTYKPFKNTTLSGSYEMYHNFNSRANSEPPRDTIAYWRAHGMPTWNPVTQVAKVNGIPFNTAAITNDANLPAGLAGIGTSNVRLQQLIDGGNVVYIAPGRNPSAVAGSGANVNGVALSTNQRLVFSGTDIQRGGGGIFGGVPTPLYNMPETTDKSIYDWTSVNLAAPNYNRMRADNYNLSLAQTILNTRRQVFALQLAWYREDSLEYRRSFVAQQDGVPNILQLDTNEVLLDGKPNPYFLRAFVGGNEPQIFRRPIFNDNYRAQIAYALDLTHENNLLKWLGRHQFTGYGEYRLEMKSPNGLRYRDQVIDNTHYVSAANILGSNGGHFYSRYFVGKTPGSGVEYANTGLTQPDGQFSVAYVDPATGIWNYNDPINVQEVYFSQGMQKKKIRTEGAVLQSFLLKDHVVTTFGIRKDRLGFTDSRPLVALPGSSLLDTTNLYNYGVNKKWNKGTTKNAGVVVRPFRGLPFVSHAAAGTGVTSLFGQLLDGLSLHYNKSDAFKPEDIAYNVLGEQLPNPIGKGKDYGFSLQFGDDLYFKVNRYDTKTINSRNSLGTIAGRSIRLDFALSSTGNPDNFALYPNAIGWYTLLNPQWTRAQIEAAAQKLTGLTPAYIASVQDKAISDINNARSTGWEVELNYNHKALRLKVTGTQQSAIDTDLSATLQEHINERLPLWTTIIDPVSGLNWWTENNNAAQNFYIGNVLAPLKLGTTTAGKRKPQTREYQVNVTTNYQLSGLFPSHRYLRNAAVGGSFRWASKSSIGFLAGPPDTDGQVRTLDGAKPVFDTPTANLDLLFSYNLKLYHDRVRTRLQLNVRNVNESGRLRGIAVNPDGQVWRYRIIDPRQFILTASFDM